MTELKAGDTFTSREGDVVTIHSVQDMFGSITYFDSKSPRSYEVDEDGSICRYENTAKRRK